MIWDDLKTDTKIDLDVEESLSYTVSNLKVPAGEKYRWESEHGLQTAVQNMYTVTGQAPDLGIYSKKGYNILSNNVRF
ncbi:MAG: hypothetical protein R2741_08545 [Methanolobus sp.]